MTHNNISYLEVLEKKRSNEAQEAEARRSNQAKELNTRYAADLDAQVRRETAQISAATSQLVADINRESQAAVAGIHAGASVQVANIGAETTRYVTDVNAGLEQQNIDERGRHNLVTEDVQHTGNTIQSIKVQNEADLGFARLEQDDYYRGIEAEQQGQKLQQDYAVGASGVLARILPALAGLTS